MVLRDGNLDKFAFNIPDPSATVWRYMDFAKYVSMISSSALYFTNIRRLDDKFEGSWPKRLLEIRRQSSKTQLEKLHQRVLKENPENHKHLMPLDETLEAFEKYRSWEANYTFVNCWHMAENESMAMWKIYGPAGKALAIRTNVYRLDHEIAKSPSLVGLGEPTDFLAIGLVSYEDFSQIDNSWYELPFARAFLKRPAFSFEKELRVVLGHTTGRIAEAGYPIRVNLGKLIEEVRISPGSDNWFAKTVEEVTKIFGYEFIVKKAELDEEPIF